MTRRERQWRLYWSLLSPFRGSIAVQLCLGLIASAIAVTQPFLYHYVIDEIAMKPDLDPSRRLGRLALAMALMVGFMALSFAANYLNSYRTTTLNYKVTARLRHKLLRHMLDLPLHALTTMKIGGAAARLNQDTEAVSQTVTRALIGPSVAVVQIAVAMAMAFVLNWRLALAALAVILPVAAVSHGFAKRLRPLFVEIGRLSNGLSARSTELFGGVRVVRIYRREASERRRYMRMYHQIMRRTLAVRQKQLVIDTFAGMSISLIQVIILSLGVYLSVSNQATIGDIFAIVIYSSRITGPLDQVIHAYQQLQEDLATVDRLLEVFEIEPDRFDRPGALPAPAKVESVAFEHVAFSYNGSSRKALSDITVRIAGGATVALVGRSGAGKSTLTHVLARFYDPQEGAIYLNGIDLRDVELKSYRRLLGLVQQDIFLFDGTVRDNIAYAVPRATGDEVVSAAMRANAHQFILELPEGYDTIIGERGVRLSGGQRQRISMARAFLVEPEILILDEATSNLDSENEHAIHLAMAELFRNRTTFIVAHRLSTVAHADTIIVLDEGRICEMGTHEQLIGRRGAYFRMVDRQQQPNMNCA